MSAAAHNLIDAWPQVVHHALDVAQTVVLAALAADSGRLRRQIRQATRRTS